MEKKISMFYALDFLDWWEFLSHHQNDQIFLPLKFLSLIVFLFSFGSVKIPLTVKSKQRNQLQYVRLKTKTKVSCHHLAYKWILISPLQLSRDCSQWTPSSTDADKKIAVTPQAGYRHPSHCLNYHKVRMDRCIFVWKFSFEPCLEGPCLGFL